MTAVLLTKSANLSTIYGACAVCSLILLIAGILLVKKYRRWFLLLLSSVTVVNLGYTLLSMAPTLSFALHANRIAYLGSVFLPLSMLMIILQITNVKYKRIFPATLLALAAAIFLIAASPGILPIYYKSVSLETVDGVSRLIKEYGPLHPLYLVYLLGYFGSMAAVIVQAWIKKAFDGIGHAVVVALAVFVNLGVWLIGQVTPVEYEMLSVSYIISEAFLLGVRLVINENQRLKDQVRQKEAALTAAERAAAEVSEEEIILFLRGLKTLTPTEKAVYDAYRKGASTKEVLEQLGITENTLKFHNKNLYGKLGVSSRKQLLRISASLPESKG